MSAVLQAPTAKRGQPKSEHRTAVEAAMQAARVPLDAPQLQARTGERIDKVRTALYNLCQERKAHRLPPLPGERNYRYAWGAAPSNPPASQRCAPTGTYCGTELRPYTARDGALRAFDLPSVENGKTVPRERPILLGTTKPDARPR